MAETWIDFAYAAELNGGKGGVLVIGPDAKFGFVSEDEYDQKYCSGRGKLMQEIGWEKCFKLGELLQSCYS